MDAKLLKDDTGGFTLIEVLIAMVILGIAVLGVQAAVTDRFVRDVGTVDRESIAMQLVEDRIHAIQLDPVYATLEDRYEVEESDIPGYPGFTRSTIVLRTRDETPRGVVDRTRITVRVEAAALAEPVSRTIAVAAP